MAPAPPIELFMELKPQKTTSLVKWSHAKQGLSSKVLPYWYFSFITEGLKKKEVNCKLI
jgi:hypothetical protein